MADPRRVIYIGETTADSDTSIGMCRFDIDQQMTSAEVSINLNPDHRGKGLSTALLLQSIETFHAEFHDIVNLTAVIKESNIPSRKLFLAAGFTPVSEADGVGAYEFRLAN